jgi:hypothetical protein
VKVALLFTMSVNAPLLNETCHFCTVPIAFITDNVVLGFVSQTEVAPDNVPPSLGLSTVTVEGLEKSCAQTPFFITARNTVVLVKLPKLSEVVVLLIVANGPNTDEADSHEITEPVFPLSVSVPEFELEHTLGIVATVPPTVASVTVVLATDDAHGPKAVVMVYTPEFEEVLEVRIGFCKVEVNPAGPTQL